jgi:peptidoglycan/xylan/chitin deacetylase (PgdA/CDA1 family)
MFWPDNARLVVSISMQFEAGAQDLHAEGPFPPLDPRYTDTITPSWYAYGMTEGIPRLLDLWDRLNVKVTSHMVGRAIDLHPALAKEVVERGHEAAAHGQTWTPQFSMTPEEERASYQANIGSIERATGVRPIGFNAFWMRQTPRTLSILQELGFLYHIDDLGRDEPSIRAVNGRPFVVVPYTHRNNDIVRFDNPAMTASAFAQELKDDFDVLYAEADRRRRQMSISTHDRISGQPAKAKAIGEFISYAQRHPGVVFMRKDTIARWVLEQKDVPSAA